MREHREELRPVTVDLVERVGRPLLLGDVLYGADEQRRAPRPVERERAVLEHDSLGAVVPHDPMRLMDDLLDVTRISRGKIELRRERVELRDVVLRAADDFQALMEKRGSPSS